MGYSFSSIQIKNYQKLDKGQFEKLLCKHMTKIGFISAQKDDAHITYRAVFSDKSDWVTLCSDDYPGESVKRDAQPKCVRYILQNGAAVVHQGMPYKFEGINEEHQSMQGNNRYSKKSSDLVFKYQTFVRFTAVVMSGNKHKIFSLK